jgi:hypothetical protein
VLKELLYVFDDLYLISFKHRFYPQPRLTQAACLL